MEKNSPFTSIDEVQFWGKQISEHQLLISSGIVLQSYINQLNSSVDTGIDTNYLIGKANKLHDNWKQISETYDAKDNTYVLDKIDKTIRFQNKLLGYIDNGIFIGYLYPSLIEHMNKETKYLESKLRGKGYNYADEVNFWLDHHLGETAIAEKQLDPEEKALSKTIESYDKDIESLLAEVETVNFEEINYVIDEYNILGNELLEKIFNSKVLSISPAALIEHAIREGNRAREIFTWLESNET